VKNPQSTVVSASENPNSDKEEESPPVSDRVEKGTVAVDVSQEKVLLETAVEELEKSPSRDNVAEDVGTLAGPSGVLPNNTTVTVDEGSWTDDDHDVNEDPTTPVEKDGSGDRVEEIQDVDVEEDLIITNEKIVHSTPDQGVAGRTRLRSGRTPVLLDPPRTRSKGSRPTEKKKLIQKRKEIVLVNLTMRWKRLLPHLLAHQERRQGEEEFRILI
jgi:hypothetical protein